MTPAGRDIWTRALRVNRDRDNGTTVQVGSSWLGLLGLLFIGLKLIHVIEWSWWWVLAPLWAPWALVIAIFLFIAVATP
jgi:hypothetical protein